MDGEAWGAAAHGVTKSQTRLSNWTEAADLYFSLPKNALTALTFFYSNTVANFIYSQVL